MHWLVSGTRGRERRRTCTRGRLVRAICPTSQPARRKDLPADGMSDDAHPHHGAAVEIIRHGRFRSRAASRRLEQRGLMGRTALQDASVRFNRIRKASTIRP